MDLPGGPSSASGGAGSDVTRKARRFAGQLAQSAGRTVQQWSVRKYTLPDKNVASQVLMYRQLLHTKCRPSLKLSRDYQATPVQQAVKHMPWWSEGMEESGRMVISYDNLIRRLWLDGAVLVHEPDTGTELETYLNAEGLPPVPHPFWVDRLGFQQPDPVTDFRSGGVLSLALMVHVVESCPDTFRRFVRPTGDASVLPFGITSINITDMIAKFLMFAKSVDRMDALLSQKPFWNMFADPNAILVCKELSMDLLADVVVELRTEREFYNAQQQLEKEGKALDTTATTTTISAGMIDPLSNSDSNDSDKKKDVVTVFDFCHILERTTRRVEDDLLGAGPQSVQELRVIHGRLKTKYSLQLEARLQKLAGTNAAPGTSSAAAGTGTTLGGSGSGSPTARSPNNAASTSAGAPPGNVKTQVLQHATGLASGASALAGNFFSKLKTTGFAPVKTTPSQPPTPPSAGTGTPTVFAPTVVDIPPPAAAATKDFLSGSPLNATATTAAPEPSAPTNTNTFMTDVDSDDGDWSGTDIQSATEGVSNFSIAGDDEDDSL